jgi:hypothetical protein
LDKGAAAGDFRFVILRDFAITGSIFGLEPITEPPTDPPRGNRYEDPFPAHGWEYGGVYLLSDWRAAPEDDEESEVDAIEAFDLQEEVVYDASQWAGVVSDNAYHLLLKLEVTYVAPHRGKPGAQSLERAFAALSNAVRMWAEAPELLQSSRRAAALAQNLLDEVRYAAAFCSDGFKRNDIDAKRLTLGERNFGPHGGDGLALALSHLTLQKKKDKEKEVTERKKKRRNENVTCYVCGEKGHYKFQCPRVAGGGAPRPAGKQSTTPGHVHVAAVPLPGNGVGGARP